LSTSRDNASADFSFDNRSATPRRNRCSRLNCRLRRRSSMMKPTAIPAAIAGTA
jgi:hypothetical protein